MTNESHLLSETTTTMVEELATEVNEHFNVDCAVCNACQLGD